MKKLFIFILSFFLLQISAGAQITGGFNLGNDGHIYFQAMNQTYYTYQVNVVAESSDRNNSESRTLRPGDGFYLGPSTPWKWFWKKGDRLSVVYPNGQYQYWTCPSNDKAYSYNVSFGRSEAQKYNGKKCGVLIVGTQTYCHCTGCSSSNRDPFICSKCKHRCDEHTR